MEEIEVEAAEVLEEVARRRNWVNKMKANKHVKGTDDAYAGKVADFVAFVFRVSPNTLAPSFRQVYEKLPPAATGIRVKIFLKAKARRNDLSMHCVES
jgi:hypothetical protein